jgi:hypothetical protein
MWNAIRRTVYAMIAIFNVASILVLFWLFMIGHFGQRPSSPWDLFKSNPPASGIEYKDFISILLTALGLMIALLATFMALAAIWGFNVLKEATEIAAKKEASIVAEREAQKVAEQVATRVTVELWSQVKGTIDDDYGRAGGTDVGGKD